MPNPALAPPNALARPPIAGTRLTIQPTDVLRDLGALAVLIWVLTVPWTAVGTGGHLVYVLLPVICSMASLALPYLGRLLVGANGAPLFTRTIGPRLALNAPLAVTIMVAVIWDAVDAIGDGDGMRVLGPGLLAGCFGLALSAVPRLAELRPEPDGPRRAQRWRRFIGWAAGLGLVAIVVSTLVEIVRMTQYGDLGGLFALLLLIIALEVGFFVALLAIPALRVGADHPAWQPTVLWLAAAFVFVLLAVGGSSTAAESFGQPFYGLWLLMLAGGGCAVPFVGGSDPSTEDARFWALVVANAFRTIVVAGCFLVAVCLLGLILSGQQGSVPGELIWALIAMVIVTIAGAVGSSRLRAGMVQGRNAALGAVAVMVLVTIITMAVSGIGVDQGGGLGNLVGLGLMFGPFVTIVVGLTVPGPVREAMAVHQGVRPGATAAWPAPTQTQAVPTHSTDQEPVASPTPAGWPAPAPTAAPSRPASPTTGQAPGWAVEATRRIEPAASVPVPEAAPGAGTALADDDMERTVMRPARSVVHRAAAEPEPTARATTAGAAAAPVLSPESSAASDPATPLQDLMTIARNRPDLRPQIAENPSTYPDLLTWLGQLNDPAVNAALARRRGTPQ